MKKIQLLSMMLVVIAIFLFQSCQEISEAQRIVDAAIKAHGGSQFEKSQISFEFRKRQYSIFKSPSQFEYSREFTDSTGHVIKDILNNDGFERLVDGTPVNLPEDKIRAYSNSVNSVAYFAFLPYGLNDPAVFKEYLGETGIENKTYHLIKVTFSEDGGGEDHEDEFLFWFDQDSYLLDYLAYSYLTEGGGVRFRKAIKRHEVNGLILTDYENYEPLDKNAKLEEMEVLYQSGGLKLLSLIQKENVAFSIK